MNHFKNVYRFQSFISYGCVTKLPIFTQHWYCCHRESDTWLSSLACSYYNRQSQRVFSHCGTIWKDIQLWVHVSKKFTAFKQVMTMSKWTRHWNVMSYNRRRMIQSHDNTILSCIHSKTQMLQFILFTLMCPI